MDPFKMSTRLDEAINHIDQTAATLELLLEHIFEYDSVDLNGTEAEVMAAMDVCRQYPMWRAVLTRVWESTLDERDELAALVLPSADKPLLMGA